MNAQSTSVSTTRYSVIVPAYNAAGTIDACLQALLDQSVPRDSFEVLVVDDGSRDATVRIASRYPILVLRQAHCGPASARNLGARAARGELLLFTDADCVPARNWIAEMVRPLEADSQIAGVKGAYRTSQRNLVARFAQVEFEEKYAKLRSKKYIDFIDTYSAAFRRDAFWESGAFDPSFPSASNEDTQLSFDLASMGRRLVFAENAIVSHRHPESLRPYLQRKWRHAFWRVRVYRRHPRKMAGDNYTPRSTQLQMVSVALAAATVPASSLRVFSLAFGGLFLLATLPFVRRALASGWEVALAVPFILFLRALVMWAGLVLGTLMLLISTLMEVRQCGSHS